MEIWRFIPLESRNGYWNMALDEAVLNSVISGQSPNTLRFFKWFPSTITIGRNQSLSDEVFIDIANENGFNVVRRITGGGAVFHDKDREITYSIACPLVFLKELKANKTLEQFEIITQGIISGLHLYGLSAEKGVIHCPALFLDGKKISGNAQVRKKGYLLQHGTILLDLDPELMYSVLKAPQGVSKTRMVRSVYAKCVGIKDYITEYDEERMVSALKKGFEIALGIRLEEGSFTDQELEMANHLVKKRYSNKEWLSKYE
ncbi:MAG: lipoate--protein ligase family protein [Candidatus Lokiarchaeota archaeon]|nr:lipoate--protein ligase family protein [Candidatus Lokiarchaeota archaeon]